MKALGERILKHTLKVMKSYRTPNLLPGEENIQNLKEVLFGFCRRRFFVDTILNFIQPVGRASSLSCADGQEEILQIYLLRSWRGYKETTVVFFTVTVKMKVQFLILQVIVISTEIIGNQFEFGRRMTCLNTSVYLAGSEQTKDSGLLHIIR